MSEENVEIAREAFRLFQAGDPAWLDWVDPEIEWDFTAYPLADLPSRGRGREALLRLLDTYYSGWIDLGQEIVEMVDAGDDVVVVVHEVARMRDSEAEIERDVAHLWTVRDRKWVFWRIYPDRNAALRAAGISE